MTRHQGTIYSAVEVGPLVWTSAWDGKIFTWNSTTLNFFREVPNLHHDAIRDMLPIWTETLKGWQIWTAANDQSINVLFVPQNYQEMMKRFARRTRIL